MYSDEDLWHALMATLADISAAYLHVQVAAGASAIQLFDSWVGALSAVDYARYVMPHSQRILSSLAETGVPRIHFGVNTGELLPLMRDAGADVVGVDYRLPLGDAAERVGDERCAAGQPRPGGHLRLAGRRAHPGRRRAGVRPRPARSRVQPRPRCPADQRPRGARRRRATGSRAHRALADGHGLALALLGRVTARRPFALSALAGGAPSGSDGPRMSAATTRNGSRTPSVVSATTTTPTSASQPRSRPATKPSSSAATGSTASGDSTVTDSVASAVWSASERCWA